MEQYSDFHRGLRWFGWVCFNDKYVLVAVWIGHSSDFPQTGRIFRRSLQLFRRGRSET